MIWRGWGGWLQGFSILGFVGRLVKLANLIFGILAGFTQKKPKSLFGPSSFRPLPLPPCLLFPRLPFPLGSNWIFGFLAQLLNANLFFGIFARFGQVARKVKELIWRGWGKGGGCW